jgi:hypothetical protein
MVAGEGRSCCLSPLSHSAPSFTMQTRSPPIYSTQTLPSLVQLLLNVPLKKVLTFSLHHHILDPMGQSESSMDTVMFGLSVWAAQAPFLQRSTKTSNNVCGGNPLPADAVDIIQLGPSGGLGAATPLLVPALASCKSFALSRRFPAPERGSGLGDRQGA